MAALIERNPGEAVLAAVVPITDGITAAEDAKGEVLQSAPLTRCVPGSVTMKLSVVVAWMSATGIRVLAEITSA